MAPTRFTVTLPDGSVASRTSKSRTYTHVVVAGPADPIIWKTYWDQEAAKSPGEAESFDAFRAYAEKELELWPWEVIAWSGSAALAVKASRSKIPMILARRGRQIRVMEVDPR
jgi:hypothetical protein